MRSFAATVCLLIVLPLPCVALEISSSSWSTLWQLIFQPDRIATVSENSTFANWYSLLETSSTVIEFKAVDCRATPNSGKINSYVRARAMLVPDEVASEAVALLEEFASVLEQLCREMIAAASDADALRIGLERNEILRKLLEIDFGINEAFSNEVMWRSYIYEGQEFLASRTSKPTQ